ncbi:MAG TPA: NAD+ synthase [Firmicutes bacterium]|nr:NAD+ synthase [Bacillota bacterium]
MSSLDAEKVASGIASWMRDILEKSGARGFVVGVSGGVDSATVLGLACRAAPDHVQALILPCESQPKDLEDAAAVIERFGVPHCTVELTPVYRCFLEQLPALKDVPGLVRANLKPRLRMMALYYFANALNYLVAGTGNRSEAVMGYCTKYGDGGVDLLPIGCLLKREVRELARYLGVPERIITKPPTAGLWPGQTDEAEMGITYAVIDEFLLTGAATEDVAEKIRQRYRASYHKRAVPPVPDRDRIGLA